MNEPESNLQNPSTDFAEKCDDLRRQLNLVFGAMIIISFTVTAYLALEARRATADLALLKPQADAAMKLVHQEDERTQAVLAKLSDFGRAHPDFQNRVLSKYQTAMSAAPKK